MGYSEAVWDLDDDPEGNAQHIAENGIAKDEVEEVLENTQGFESSRSSGRPIAFGETSTGRIIAVILKRLIEKPFIQSRPMRWNHETRHPRPSPDTGGSS